MTVDVHEALWREHRPAIREPADFDALWERTLAESRAVAEPPRAVPYATTLTTLDVFDVTFSGFAGDPIKAWYLRPAGTDATLPTVVEYAGYTGGRDRARDRLVWASSGFAHLVMDSRGQGSQWATGGVTPDPHGAGPTVEGYLTRGVEDIEGFYYRRLCTDAALAVDAARQLPGVDPQRVAVAGGSQGGGLALAAAGLVTDVAAAMIDFPFLCHFEDAVRLAGVSPYGEIGRYLARQRGQEEATFTTLSYVDGVNFAARATAPALWSVGLVDDVCPPATIFAAYNRYAGEKEIAAYPFNGHEGGGSDHGDRQIAWYRELVS